MTYPQLGLSFPISEDVDYLRYEFIALEAPGMPEDDNKDPEEYDDELWMHLLGLVEAQKIR